MCKWILTAPLLLMTMVGMKVDSMRKMEECFERAPANLKQYLAPRMPKALKTFEGINAGLKFQFEMLGNW